jgi:hypothetical protein
MNDKVPIPIIIAVVIFILIFVVIIASYGSKEVTTKTIPYHKTQKSATKSIANQKLAQKITPHKHLDSCYFDFIDLNESESYIFAAPMNYSTVSVYKDDILIYSKVFSGNNGFVLSNNIQNVNASFFQIGKKVNLENLKYQYIPILPENSQIKVVVSGVSTNDLYIYKCNFNENIINEGNMLYVKSKSFTQFNSIPISEYDLEKYINNTNRELPQRSFDKNHKHTWHFQSHGDYVVYYVKGLYKFSIEDKDNNISIEESNNHLSLNKFKIRDLNKIVQNTSLEHFYVTNPSLTIINKDENIPEKSINSDLIKLFNTPIELYNQFVYGKKNISLDMWNRLHNKIFIYKVL